MNEDNYQCSCGLCFFARETNLIDEHHRLTGHRKGKIRTVKAITNDILTMLNKKALQTYPSGIGDKNETTN